MLGRCVLRMKVLDDLGLTFLQRSRRRKLCLTYLCAFSLLSVGLYSLQLTLLTIKYYNPPASSFSNNYFLSADEVLSMGYLVQTPTCSVLNVSAWDEAILSILIQEDVSPADCRANERQWTYTLNSCLRFEVFAQRNFRFFWLRKDSSLVINETAIRDSGYSPESIVCCYYSISRVTQSLDNYDASADSRIRYSSSCTPLKTVITPLRVPYVRVHCKAKYWILSSDILYRRFHAVALFPPTTNFTEKMDYWKTAVGPKPPNVLVVGIDSMSRLSFHRTMPRTMRVLQEMGAVEMLGYTKVGENTLPNVVAAVSGYAEADIRDSCFLDNMWPQDSCAEYYLWHRFSQAKYATGLVEDAPFLASFNYQKTGFVKEPTDFYFRPFMVALHQHQPSPYFTYDCVGPENVDEIMLRQISDVVGKCREGDLPFFVFSWMTNLAHGNLMAAKYADHLYAQFLQNLNLSNTVLVFMGDHGYRFGSIRQTFPGWYEDKLPTFWIHLPPQIKDSRPRWLKSLKTNSARLTSTFDLYRTISQILDEFSGVDLPPHPTLRHRSSGKEIQRRFGHSLLSEVPLRRKCGEAGIRETYCACVVPQRLPLNDTHLKEAAAATASFINSLLPPQCARLKVASVDAGAELKASETDEGTVETATYVVAFQTFPGQFQFEATVAYNARNSTSSGETGPYKVASDVLRMNKIANDVSCVHDAFMERLCFCASQVPSRA